MSVVAALRFPSGRAVAGWWRQLRPYEPRSLWIGHLLLHRVEASVEVCRDDPIGPCDAALLMLLKTRGPAPVAELAERLFIDTPLARRQLGALRSRAWVAFAQDDRCELTASGRVVCETRSYRSRDRERRAFYFLEPDRLLSAPAFLALESDRGAAWAGGPEWRFDPRELEACVQRSPDWKKRHGFPTDVVAIEGSGGIPSDPPVAIWQDVIIHQPARLSAALIVTGDGNRAQCLGFAFQEQGWRLEAREPAFRLGATWAETFPELAEPIALDDWRHAWQEWLRSRGVVAEESSSCRLERSGHQLQMYARVTFLERLRSALRPAVQGDIWLLAGNGRFREAVHVQLQIDPS